MARKFYVLSLEIYVYNNKSTWWKKRNK
jgi:hypothetical protein